MYCIDCGAKIPNNSKFCSYCGKKQSEGEQSLKEKIAEIIIEKEIHNQILNANKSSLDYEFLKKATGWYLAWVVLHLGFLLIYSSGVFEGNNMGSNNFWPFGEYSRLREYDITEFLVYTIFPLAILVIISLVRTREKQPQVQEGINEIEKVTIETSGSQEIIQKGANDIAPTVIIMVVAFIVITIALILLNNQK
jgi:hypothetical protein